MSREHKPKICAVAPWAGGKRTLAPRIVDLLGFHYTYVEPFVGGCAILPRKPRSAEEHVADANPALVNVLTCLRDWPAELAAHLVAVAFDRDTFAGCCKAVDSAAAVPTEPVAAVHLAACQLTAWWMGPNGLAGTDRTGWFATRHTRSGGDPAVRWDSFRASVPALAARLRGVEVHKSDFRALLCPRRFDFPGVAIYCDPPYFSKSFRYAHDFSPADHAELARLLNGFRSARVVVSYYDEAPTGTLFRGSLLDDLYPPDRWERHDVEVAKASAHAAGGRPARATEVLLASRGRAA